jgi:hypothetical protein
LGSIARRSPRNPPGVLRAAFPPSLRPKRNCCCAALIERPGRPLWRFSASGKPAAPPGGRLVQWAREAGLEDVRWNAPRFTGYRIGAVVVPCLSTDRPGPTRRLHGFLGPALVGVVPSPSRVGPVSPRPVPAVRIRRARQPRPLFRVRIPLAHLKLILRPRRAVPFASLRDPSRFKRN